MIDIGALDKLNDLKEKGIITQAEFDKQKAALISSKKGVSWKNFFYSFLLTVLFVGIQIAVITVILISQQIEDGSYYRLINVISAVALTVLAVRYKFSEYKNCASPVAVFICSLILGPLAMWCVLYQYLQIKQGNAVKK